MKKVLLCFSFLFTAALYSQIGFQANEVTSFNYQSQENLTGDLDNDGDTDIVSFGTTTIDWFENNYPQPGFKPRQNITSITGAYIITLDISDFDNDGDLDILGADLYGDKLFLHTNLDGQGTFGARQVIKTINDIYFVKHIDMDNDGDKDLFYRDGAAAMGYYENTNLPTNYIIYHSAYNLSTSIANDIQFSDFDGDGDQDLFFRLTNSLSWIKNNGGGTFSNFIIVASNTPYYRYSDLGDIDGDGDDDIIAYIEYNGNNKLVYYLNDGFGNFGAQQLVRQNLTTVYALKVDDLDGDSRMDIAVSIKNLNVDYYSDVQWYKNNGSYVFSNPAVIDTKIRQLNKIETFDVNNDNTKDIVTASHFHRLTTYQNTGAGGFQSPKYPGAANMGASCAIAGDIDNDGDLDVVTSSSTEGKIYLYKKAVDGTYENQLIVTHDVPSVKKVAVADMDGDADLDIVAISGPSTSGYYDRVSWYKNLDGQGTFGAQINIPIDIYDSPDGLAVYDVDADGDKDIVTSLTDWPSPGDRIIWYGNNGSGSFGSEQIIASGPVGVKALKEADLDHDGDMDLVCASSQDNKVGWFENLNGLGSFGTYRLITAAALNVTDFSVADLDSDGIKDIVYMSNGSDDNILWQKNTDGLGNFGAQRLINSNVDVNGSSTIAVADLDNDADMDVLVGEYTTLKWIENLHGQANFEPAKTIASNFSTPSSSQISDYDNDGELDILMASSGNNKVVWFNNLGLTKNTIKGTVRFDVAGNGCDAGDRLLPNILVSTTNGSSTEATVTFRNEFAGQYRLYTDQGNFQTSIIANLPPYFMLTPLSHSTSFTGYGNIATADFCIEPIGQLNDLNVALYPLAEARPGFDTAYQLVYSNIGTTTLTGQVTVQYDNSKIQFLNSAIAPTSQTANTLTFDFTNLAPFAVQRFRLNFNVFAPPTTPLGSTLVFTSAITPAVADQTADDNTFVLNHRVIGSFDPNDITCLEGDEVLLANEDKYLHYVIRFQNTGTASAINVKVQHVLDPKLDWTTFQLDDLSHNGRVTIKDENLVEFMFHNINLPDSTTNEPNSHGFIAFKIKPVAPSVNAGDVVNATANIYFDYNPPITTNTAATTFVNTLGTDAFDAAKFSIYPNPAREQLVIQTEEEVLQVEIHSILGAKVLAEGTTKVVSVSALEAGVYFISVKTKSGTSTRKFIKL